MEFDANGQEIDLLFQNLCNGIVCSSPHEDTRVLNRSDEIMQDTHLEREEGTVYLHLTALSAISEDLGIID
jgi:hypothetical protein